ncbi:RNA polymerase sporulation sigma factor SigF [Jeotgalibacillus proteolyticus]|uniref:RNA polymerase sigma factor n=1 Tax=Jeotgalibacillus proteolyticus TaxID=2082395 RepID=A0A2S5GEA0_9BACL|nr:RNA polymerase sporulation sigma factor SigF [Jeotgalibacillus proteolyticus]PPA71309.1 RNA polymerase sporulation sigma factor SigF [Jeotgalibacillus proteolyticus]
MSAKTTTNHETVREWIRLSQAGDQEARSKMVETNVRLVWSVVQRFLNRGHDPDDLFQIGAIGLLKAVDKFDLSYSVKFSTYAVPMIIGEIQRFLRDDGTVKVSRSVKELAIKVRRAKEQLSSQYGRLPTLTEIAEELDVTVDDIVLSQDASRAPASIHETVYENEGDPITLLDQMASKDEEQWFHQLALKEALLTLEKRDRVIIFLRYYKDFTQSEVAEKLGISQVQVSRIEKRVLQSIREWMDDVKEA